MSAVKKAKAAGILWQVRLIWALFEPFLDMVYPPWTAHG